MRYVLLLWLASCGYDPCVSADYVVDNLCVTTNGHDIDPVLVADTIAVTQAVLGEYGHDLDLPLVLEQYRVGVEYVDVNVDSVYLAYQQHNYLVVEAWPDGDLYAYTAHELLHMVAEMVLGVSYEINSKHTYPFMFVQGVPGEPTSIEITINSRLKALE
jgi:hypothetical protein